jgi:hypothetical protein
LQSRAAAGSALTIFGVFDAHLFARQRLANPHGDVGENWAESIFSPASSRLSESTSLRVARQGDRRLFAAQGILLDRSCILSQASILIGLQADY